MAVPVILLAFANDREGAGSLRAWPANGSGTSIEFPGEFGALRDLTTLSLPWRERQKLLWESQEEAITRFDERERSFGRHTIYLSPRT